MFAYSVRVESKSVRDNMRDLLFAIWLEDGARNYKIYWEFILCELAFVKCVYG